MMKRNYKELKGTQTEQHLLGAFQAEAVAVVKYKLFADKSEYKSIEEMFKEVARNEEEHAEVILELLCSIGDDTQNLKHSIALEGFTSAVDYPGAAKVAKEEGFAEITDIFTMLSDIEARHKRMFERFLIKLEKDALLKSRLKDRWVCLKCGYIHDGIEPPEWCPVCEHSNKDFKLYREED